MRRLAAAAALFVLSCGVSLWSVSRNFEGGVSQEFCHYAEIARNIREGKGYRTALAFPSTLAYFDSRGVPFEDTLPVLDRFPLFAYVIAAAQGLGGGDDAPVMVVSIVSLALCAAAAFLLGCWFFSPLEGAVAGALVALNPSFQRGFVLWAYPDFCFALAVLAAMAMTARGLFKEEKRAAWWLAAGGFAGLAWLTRANMMLWLPLFALALWSQGASARARARRLAFFVLGLAAVYSPAAVYNLRWYGSLNSPGVMNWFPQYIVIDGLPGTAYRLFEFWPIVRDHFPALMTKFKNLLFLQVEALPTWWQMHLIFPAALYALCRPFSKGASALVALALSMLAVELAVFSTLRFEVLGPKIGGRYYLWLAPVLFVLGARGASALGERLGKPRAALAAFAGLNLAFFVWQLASPQGGTIHPGRLRVADWPELRRLAELTGPDELVATNIPGQVVWYSRRRAVMLPRELSDLEAIDRRHSIDAILLSRLSVGELGVLPIWLEMARNTWALEAFARRHGFPIVDDFGTAVLLRRAKA